MKAKVICTISEFSKKAIVEKYKVDERKIQVIHNGINELYKPVNQVEREAIKEKYSDDKEYFIFTGAVAPVIYLINLLKAFSIFKQKQKSNMQLLIAVRVSSDVEEFTKSLRLFKYRDDVKLLGNVSENELVKITAAAYAIIIPSAMESFAEPALEAMKCHVPVITGNAGTMPEICGDAALYSHQDNHYDIADKMMLIFKDEKLRRELVEKGKLQVLKFSWDKTAELLWESISETY